ncbi:hypothetical protein SAMN05443248_7447 [Bradyrhizobium erythrophlei]|uniref:Uncharacterized protein n=1 Tax=Bradyrhizobium erythrophlei TaxID=1437360 RepID=A0A1M5XME2_9BRAD|nr:hypothetical protein SAMN05443248_7447 [Bradyrhizobium erythrophlei]
MQAAPNQPPVTVITNPTLRVLKRPPLAPKGKRPQLGGSGTVSLRYAGGGPARVWM